MNIPRLLLRLLQGKRLPRLRGKLTVAGPRSEVTIRRDRWGIPCIEAGSERDAFFGMGFCQGQDRAFQLELLLRVSRGTLSELFGAATLAADRLARRIGFHRSAEAQLAALAGDVRELVEAFAAGVRAGSAVGRARIPHELAILKGRLTPWTAADCLGTLKLISFTLASNWDVELARWRILIEDGPEALQALDPVYLAWHPTPATPGQGAGAAVDRLAAEIAALTAIARPGGGSNNWVLAASRTSTGRPLLACDPHLDAAIPGHWYLAQMRTPGHAAAGASFVGGPGIVVGHNGHAAWGVTAGLIDNTDLFRERIGPDGLSVWRGDRLEPCRLAREVIRVRNGEDVVEEVLLTPRGPIVTPALSAGDEALSLRAVWLDPLPLRGLVCLHRVRGFEELREVTREWPATSMNLVYADAGGTIGWQMMGQAPVRRKGWGLLPQAGWDPESGWEDELLPHGELPWRRDPPEGFLATANTRPLPEGQGPYLGSDWIDGYRLASIQRALSRRRDWNVASSMRLQMDRTTLVWEDLGEMVLACAQALPGGARVHGLLRSWDGWMGEDSAAATVFELFLAEMEGRIARARAPRSAAIVLGETLSPLAPFNFFCLRRAGHLVKVLKERPEGWLDRPWKEEAADALRVVVERLEKDHGADTAAWGWGRLRPLVLHHPLGRNKMLRPVFSRGPIPLGGSTDTISQASSPPWEPLAPTDNIPSLRAVIDVGAWENSRFSLPGGQSGNPLSPHYDDLLPLWREGEGVPIPWSPDEVRRAARHTLLLRPQATAARADV